MLELLQLATIFVIIYGVCYMFGENVADGFVRRTERGVRYVGRSASRAARAFPFAAGIIVIILTVMALSKC